MHNPIQKPVTEYQSANDPSPCPVFAQKVIDQTECQHPAHRPAQAMGEWIVVKVEGLNLSDSWHDANMFESKQ